MKPIIPQGRLLSLDVYRGLTMFLLMAEAAFVYAALTDYFTEGSLSASLIQQFHHHPWNGLRFWDLIQPFFMFIVGVAMPFSLKARLKRGTWLQAFQHILYRCFMLLLLGTGLHCVYSGKIVWELWNVLTQLSFTILLTFLLLRLPVKVQFAVSMLCLILTEILYRSYDPATPFVKDQNFGSWMDLLLMNKIDDGGGWVTINCLPTAAHTIWGAICGHWLMRSIPSAQKVRYLVMAGVLGLVIGYGLDALSITPIVKRIATTAFIFASGGWALLALAFLYWLVDIKGFKKWTTFFIIVGTNSIFIYIFAETIGHQWLGGFARIFTFGYLGIFPFSDAFLAVLNAFVVLIIMWYLCYFLYKHKIFIKI